MAGFIILVLTYTYVKSPHLSKVVLFLNVYFIVLDLPIFAAAVLYSVSACAYKLSVMAINRTAPGG